MRRTRTGQWSTVGLAAILLVAWLLSAGRSSATRRAAAPSAPEARASSGVAPPGGGDRTGEDRPRSEAAALAPVTYRASGQVLGTDDEPCPSAVVALSNDDPSERRIVGSAGADGVFDLSLPPGQWWIHAEGDGAISPPCDVWIEEGGSSGNVLRFEEVGTVRGFVYDPEGRPCPGASVLLLDTPTFGSGTSWSNPPPDVAPCFARIADENGRFEVLGTPWKNYVQASFGQYAPTWREVEVKAGETVEVDIHLNTATHLEGTVFDTRGRPLSDVLVKVHSMGNPPFPRSRMTRTDAEGTWRMDRLNANDVFDIYASREGYLRQREFVDMEKGSGADIVLVRAATIEGRVRGVGGARPPDGTRVALRPATAPGGEFAPDIDGDRHELSLWTQDGTYRMQNAPPGVYVLQAKAEGTSISESGPVEVAEGVLLQGVDVTLLAGGVFRGTVRSASGGNPIGAMLAQFDAEMNFGRWGCCQSTESGGRFEVRDLTPGPHTFRFFGGAYATVEVSVDVPEGGVVERDVRMPDGARVHGRVLLDGLPATGFSVTVSPLGAQPSGSASRAPAGSFEWRGASPGTQYVTAFVGRGKGETSIRLSRRVRVEGESPLQVDFDLRTTPVVTGTVRRAGSPLTRTHVYLIGVGPNDGITCSTVTDQDGSYELVGLPPGDWFLLDEGLATLAAVPDTGSLLPDRVHAPLVHVDGRATQERADVDLPALR